MEYKIVRSGMCGDFVEASEGLELRVAILIGEGFQPQGGVSASVGSTVNGIVFYCLFQAMVKTEE